MAGPVLQLALFAEGPDQSSQVRSRSAVG
jgi:hypothetical protein